MQRRAFIRRGAPPKRHTPVRRKRETPRRSERVLDPGFVAWTHTQPCVVRTVSPLNFGSPLWARDTWFRAVASLACSGPVEHHHLGRRGMGQKADDDTGVPCCAAHHRAYHSHAWPFRHMDKAARREWVEAVISWTQKRAPAAQDGPSLLEAGR
jgi:hypothetical protein